MCSRRDDVLSDISQGRNSLSKEHLLSWAHNQKKCSCWNELALSGDWVQSWDLE